MGSLGEFTVPTLQLTIAEKVSATKLKPSWDLKYKITLLPTVLKFWGNVRQDTPLARCFQMVALNPGYDDIWKHSVSQIQWWSKLPPESSYQVLLKSEPSPVRKVSIVQEIVSNLMLIHKFPNVALSDLGISLNEGIQTEIAKWHVYI